MTNASRLLMELQIWSCGMFPRVRGSSTLLFLLLSAWLLFSFSGVQNYHCYTPSATVIPPLSSLCDSHSTSLVVTHRCREITIKTPIRHIGRSSVSNDTIFLVGDQSLVYLNPNASGQDTDLTHFSMSTNDFMFIAADKFNLLTRYRSSLLINYVVQNGD